MFKYILKIHIRTTYILIPFIFLIFSPIEIIFKTKYSLWMVLGFMALQKSFINPLQHLPLNLTILRIYNFKIGKFLAYHNSGLLLWINLWYLTIEIPFIFLGYSSDKNLVFNIFSVNIVSITSFIIGNELYMSDLLTIKNNFVRLLMFSFIFQLSMVFAFIVLVVMHYITINQNLILFFITAIIISIYFIRTNSFEHHKYFKYVENDQN